MKLERAFAKWHWMAVWCLVLLTAGMPWGLRAQVPTGEPTRLTSRLSVLYGNKDGAQSDSKMVLQVQHVRHQQLRRAVQLPALRK